MNDMQMLADIAGMTAELIESGKLVRVVRCKDCEKKGNSYLCRLDRDLEEYGSHRTDAYDDWFCADGKRKSD